MVFGPVMRHDLELVNPLPLSFVMVIDIDTHSLSLRKDGDFMWTYVNILLVRCLPAMHKSSPPYSAGRFKGDRIGMLNLIFLYDA